MKKALLICLCTLELASCNIEYSEASLYGPEFSEEAEQLLDETDTRICKGTRYTKSDWLLLDTFGIEKCLYISTSGAVIHRISLERETVSTIIASGRTSLMNKRPVISGLSEKKNREQDVFPSYKNEHAYVYIHPSGDYMYIIGSNCIYKSIYNREKEEFQTPNVFAGSLEQRGSAFRIPECANLLLSWCERWKN